MSSVCERSQHLRQCAQYLVLCGHALPLLGGLLHGFAEGLGILHHGFELGVGQHPQQIIQDQNQLGGHHVTVLNLCRAEPVV